MSGEPQCHRRGVRRIVRARARVAPGPALDLPRDVALRAAQFLEPGQAPVQAVELREHVHEGELLRAHERGRRRKFRRIIAAQDDAADALDHVERRADHRLVGAEMQRPRRLGEMPGERRQHAELAIHVVAGLRPRAGRWPPQHHLPVAGNQQVAQVGEARRKLPHRQRQHQARQPPREVFPKDRRVERFACARRRGLVHQAHPSRPFSRCFATAILCTSSGPS